MAGKFLTAMPPMSIQSMFPRSAPLVAGLVLSVSMMMTGLAGADALKDEIAPTGKLRVAIAISPAGGGFWSTKTAAAPTGPATTAPVDQLRVLNRARRRLWRWRGVGGTGQSNCRQTHCASDCTRADHVLQCHDDHLSRMRLSNG